MRRCVSRYAYAAGAGSSADSCSTARAALSGCDGCGVSRGVRCQRVAPNSAAGVHPSGPRKAIATRWLPIGSCGHPCAMWRCSSMRAVVPGDAAIPRVEPGASPPPVVLPFLWCLSIRKGDGCCLRPPQNRNPAIHNPRTRRAISRSSRNRIAAASPRSAG